MAVTPLRKIVMSMRAKQAHKKSVTITLQSDCLTVKVTSPDEPIVPTTGRSVCKTFSRQARKRMFDFVNKIDFEKALPGLFVSLTYPDEYYGRDFGERAQDRYLFVRWAEKRLDRPIAYLWRVEWEVRKSGKHVGKEMPHLHMMWFNVRFLDKDEIRSRWAKQLHYQDYIQTWVDPIENGKKAGIYIATYIAAPPANCVLDIPAYLNKDGRNWGCPRKELIPLGREIKGRCITSEIVSAAMSRSKAVCPWLSSIHEGSFTVYGLAAKRIFAELQEMGMDSMEE